jgi:hypothetical protein
MPPTGASGAVSIAVFVEKPVNVLLEYLGDDCQQMFRRHSLAVFDHRKIGNRRAGLPIDLYASHREVFERKMIALPEHANLGAEEMRFSPQAMRGRHKASVKLTL